MHYLPITAVIPDLINHSPCRIEGFTGIGFIPSGKAEPGTIEVAVNQMKPHAPLFGNGKGLSQVCLSPVEFPLVPVECSTGEDAAGYELLMFELANAFYCLI